MAQRRRDSGYAIEQRRKRALLATMTDSALTKAVREDPALLRDPDVQVRIAKAGGSRV